MSKFYTNNLKSQWAGFASPESQEYNSVLIDFKFDKYDKTPKLMNYGSLPRKEF